MPCLETLALDWTRNAEAFGSVSMIWDAVAFGAGHRNAPVERARRNRSPALKETMSVHERERMLDVAERLICRFGHRKIGIADIARDLGTSRARVYRFFPIRTAIHLAVCARMADRALEAVRAIARSRDAAGTRLVAMFDDLHMQARKRATEAPHLNALFAVAAEEQWEVATGYFGEITAMFEATIREGLERGELKGDDAGNAARCVTAAMMPFFHPGFVGQWIAEGNDFNSELRAQTRFVMRALGNEPE